MTISPDLKVEENVMETQHNYCHHSYVRIPHMLYESHKHFVNKVHAVMPSKETRLPGCGK